MQGSPLNFMGYRGEGCWVTETIPRLRLLFVENRILLTRPTNVEGGSNISVVLVVISSTDPHMST